APAWEGLVCDRHHAAAVWAPLADLDVLAADRDEYAGRDDLRQRGQVADRVVKQPRHVEDAGADVGVDDREHQKRAELLGGFHAPGPEGIMRGRWSCRSSSTRRMSSSRLCPTSRSSVAARWSSSTAAGPWKIRSCATSSRATSSCSSTSASCRWWCTA